MIGGNRAVRATGMNTRLVCYASNEFAASRDRLVASALRHGITTPVCWSRADLERTSFYRAHAEVLNAERGGGYWLWKPFIVAQALHDMTDGDILCYCDAAVEVIADLSPLFDLCRDGHDVLLFAGHYDDVGSPGPNTCAKWTKRDCFVSMDVDEPGYHDGQMLDASFLVLRRSRASLAFIDEWLHCCAQPQLLTDQPNVHGRPDLPQFIQHRHDQSILSLLTIRHALDVFRHPSQYGNHAKTVAFRAAGESRRYPYGAKGLYENSPYGTLLNHHRNRVELHTHRILRCGRQALFAAWSDPDELLRWFPDAVSAEMDCRRDGRFAIVLRDPRDGSRAVVSGLYVDVRSLEKLVYVWRRVGRDGASDPMRATIVLEDKGASTEIVVIHEMLTRTPQHDFQERVRSDRSAWNATLDRLEAHLVGGVAATMSPP